jgi:hypothetical protein
MNSNSLQLLIEQKAAEEKNQAERLEILALKSMKSGDIDDLLREFGQDRKKVIFEVEHFLGK